MSKSSTAVIALAIASANDAFDPESPSFQLANPGMLRDGTKVREFNTIVDGLRALMASIEKLDKDASITVGVTRYCGKNVEKELIALDYISRAKNKEVTRDTPIGAI